MRGHRRPNGDWHGMLDHRVRNIVLLNVGWRFLVFGLRMRHDGAQVRILDTHVAVSRVHHGRRGEAMAQLRGKSELFQVGRTGGMVLGTRGFVMMHINVLVMVVLVFIVMVVVLLVVGNVLVLMLIMLILDFVTGAGRVERACIHGFGGRGWVADMVCLIGLSISFGAHGDLILTLRPWRFKAQKALGSQLNAMAANWRMQASQCAPDLKE